MTTTVEAKSLSAINNLAAHPPQYPINPTGRHETLTLYISRVPGTRDIILSTFKPQKKIVGAEEVANSLYYIHLDQPTDDLLVPRDLDGVGTPRASMESTRSRTTQAIVRKPLPASAKVPNLPSSTSDGYVDGSRDFERREKFPALRKPVMTENFSADQELEPRVVDYLAYVDMPVAPQPAMAHPSAASISRKPLGARPMSLGAPPPLYKELPRPPPEAVRPATPPTIDDSRPLLPPKPLPSPTALTPESFDHLPAGQRPNRQSMPAGQRPNQVIMPVSPSRSCSPRKKQKPFTPFCLTIIRRDPASGTQWNIGKVNSFQSNMMLDDPTSPGGPETVQYPRGYPAINIHIDNSGYARFRGFPATLPPLPNMDSRPGSSSSLTRQMKDLAAATLAFNGDAALQEPEEGFARQVMMTYGRTWTHNLKGAFKKRDQSSTTNSANIDHDNEPLESPFAAFHKRHQRQSSAASTTSNESGGSANGSNFVGSKSPERDERDPERLITQPGPGLKPKGYVFVSPWDGRCEFRTSSSGRALKCRHIRNTTSQGFNPLVAAQALRDGASTGRSRSGSLNTSISSAPPVSELRFNLPNSDLFHSREDREKAAKELQEQFNKLLRINHEEGPRYMTGQNGNSEDDYGDEDSIFDFSGLGKEKAGGGNRGKRAKLGKLLVHDEGLKMLDLVIAANMGIWWQAWERSF